MTAKKDTRIQSCNGESCTLYTPSNAPIKTNYVHEGFKFQIKYFTCVKHNSYLHSATPGFTFAQGFKYKLVISSLSAANFNQHATRRSKFPAQHISSMYYVTPLSKHFISKVMTHLRKYLDMQTDFLVSATFFGRDARGTFWTTNFITYSSFRPVFLKRVPRNFRFHRESLGVPLEIVG
jgi:hypothetical protein